ncbi:YceI family protein [Qipengyuania sp. DGS5-3]|uniref:YceI family protein n=1 Tax=Qipengyuania sp. DGS5-3 TaxID=3349632 RepID=UPI0036D3B43C
MTQRLPLFALLATLAACSQPPADAPPVTNSAWTLDPANSSLSYVSIKAGELAEINSFETVTGVVSAEGAATVTIDLASVSTGVDIRDERMREVFFVVADNPTASVTAQIDPAAFSGLAVGESTTTELEGTLTLKGIEAPFQSEVRVTRAASDRVIAASTDPVIVEARTLELLDGLAQLQELAGLPSITPVVPVTFSLTFER